jgi:hypothetical protein
MGALEDKWTEIDRQIAEKEKATQGAREEEVHQWEVVINILTDRATHPGRNVEYIDLDTGEPVSGPIKGAIPMPKRFNQATQNAITTLLTRKNELVQAILDLPNNLTPDIDPGLLTVRMNDMKGELGTIARKLYVLLIADPLLTEDWLLENPDKWCPQDLAVLIARYEARNLEVVERIRSFRRKR